MPHLRLAANFPKGHEHQTPTAPVAGPRGIAIRPPDYGIAFIDGVAGGEGPLQLMPRPDRRREEQEIPPFLSRGLPPSAPNHTGLPDDLKAGIESISGFDMSDVRVHYNSSEPAALQALAYTQGTDIHVAPGQERHLPHEAWHVVQQAQGRVRPRFQLKGEHINDDQGLEREAEAMGKKSAQIKVGTAARWNVNESVAGTLLKTPAAGMAGAASTTQLMAVSQVTDYKQVGGTCGLYSLGMAISGVDKSVVNHRDTLLTLLLKIGNEVGTFVGEFMDANNLAEVAQRLGLTVNVINFGDVTDFENKLVSTGTDGVVMGYSVFNVPRYRAEFPISWLRLTRFKHLFSHWSVIESLNENKLTVRDPNNPGETRSTDIADFYQSNQDAYHPSGKFSFPGFHSRVQNVAGLRTTWEQKELDERAGITLPATPLDLESLPSPRLNLKGRIVSVGGSVKTALTEKKYKVTMTSGSNDELNGEYAYMIRTNHGKCEIATGKLHSGDTIVGLDDCEIHIAPLMGGGDWIKIDTKSRQVIKGNYAIDFDEVA